MTMISSMSEHCNETKNAYFSVNRNVKNNCSEIVVVIPNEKTMKEQLKAFNDFTEGIKKLIIFNCLRDPNYVCSPKD